MDVGAAAWLSSKTKIPVNFTIPMPPAVTSIPKPVAVLTTRIEPQSIPNV